MAHCNTIFHQMLIPRHVLGKLETEPGAMAVINITIGKDRPH
jgi:hypothetical protein